MPDKIPEDIREFVAELEKLGCTVVIKEVNGELVLQVPEQEKAEQSA